MALSCSGYNLLDVYVKQAVSFKPEKESVCEYVGARQANRFLSHAQMERVEQTTLSILRVTVFYSKFL